MLYMYVVSYEVYTTPTEKVMSTIKVISKNIHNVIEEITKAVWDKYVILNIYREEVEPEVIPALSI